MYIYIHMHVKLGARCMLGVPRLFFGLSLVVRVVYQNNAGTYLHLLAQHALTQLWKGLNLSIQYTHTHN